MTLFLALSASAVIAAQQSRDESVPAGLDVAFEIAGLPDQLTRSQQIGLVNTAVNQAGANLYLRVRSVSSNASTDRIYAFIGDQDEFDQRFPENHYPSFRPDRTVDILPSSQLDSSSLTTLYFSDGAAGQLADLRQRLVGYGYQIDDEQDPPPPTELWGLLLNPLLTLAIGVGLAGVALSGLFHGFSQAQIMAVAGAHGWRRSRVVLGGYVPALFAYLAVAALVAATATVGLWWYNSLAQYESMVSPWLEFVVVGVVVFTVCYIVMMSALIHVSVSRLLRGGRPYRLLGAAAGATQALGVIAALIVLASAASTVATVEHDGNLDQRWLSAQGTVRIQLGGALRPSDWTAVDSLVGDLARHEAMRGEFVLAQPWAIDDPTSQYAVIQGDGDYAHFPRGTWLQANQAYLNHNPLVDNGGAVIDVQITSPGEIVLILPDTLSPLEEDYVGAIESLARDLRGSASPPLDPKTPTRVRVIHSRAGQDIFSYDSNQPDLGSIPVAVFSDELLSDDSMLTSSVSQGAGLFTNGAALRQEVVESGLGQYVASVESVSDKGVEAAQQRITSLALAVAEIAMITAGSIGSSYTLATAYCHSARKRIFVQSVNGVGFWKVHAGFIAALVTGTVAVTGLTLMFLPPSPAALVPQLAFAVAYTVAVLAMVRRQCAKAMSRGVTLA